MADEELSGLTKREEKFLRASVEFYKTRCQALQESQLLMQDPERRMVVDILANGKLLPHKEGCSYRGHLHTFASCGCFDTLYPRQDATLGWQKLTQEIKDMQLKHVGNHQGDVYHAMQSLHVQFGYKVTGPLWVSTKLKEPDL